MQIGRRFTLFQALKWEKRYLFIILLWNSIPPAIYAIYKVEWLHIPWQPISLIGIAVAFYLGFKNNSSYERLWEARKIWSGIINSSRIFSQQINSFINFTEEKPQVSDSEKRAIHDRIIFRHLAWVNALSLELRKPKEWEHNSLRDQEFRKKYDIDYSEDRFKKLKNYLSEEEYNFTLSCENKSLHILNLQVKELLEQRHLNHVNDYQHRTILDTIAEFNRLQGKCERIKNFPFPRQYATVNYFFVILFITLLPFGMLDIFTGLGAKYWIWLSIPFSTICSWVFWTSELVGDYSENPFEGTYNDVPIKALTIAVERDLLTMMDMTENGLPDHLTPINDYKIIV